MVSQQLFGSQPLKALKLKVAAVKTHCDNCVYVCVCVSETVRFLIVSMDLNHYGTLSVAGGLLVDF